MGTDRVRIPKKRTEPVRVAGYVRISAENHPHSTKQKSAIRRYAERRNSTSQIFIQIGTSATSGNQLLTSFRK